MRLEMAMGCTHKQRIKRRRNILYQRTSLKPSFEKSIRKGEMRRKERRNNLSSRFTSYAEHCHILQKNCYDQQWEKN